MTQIDFLRPIRSYVNRDGRMTEAQRSAYTDYWPRFGLSVDQGKLNLAQVFQRKAPCTLEIGFGTGQSLLSIAKENPDLDFIGVEAYLPGIGALLLGMRRQKLTNIRVYHADAVTVLDECIPNNSLAGIQIFFPDPWPKRRHHKRRLIQPTFTEKLVNALKKDGILHLATDWQHYAAQMMKVLTAHPGLINLSGPDEFSSRSTRRPIITKFEQRGLISGREIWELQFARIERDNEPIE